MEPHIHKDVYKIHPAQLLEDGHNVLYWTYPDFPITFDSYPCDITAYKHKGEKEFGGYPFQKESHYIELFNHHLLHIQQGGLETEYFDSLEETSRVCKDVSGNGFEVGNDGVISVFILFGIGCLVSLIYSLLERFCKKRQTQTNY